MERKRKLPARAAARVDHVSKKRNTTPSPVDVKDRERDASSGSRDIRDKDKDGEKEKGRGRGGDAIAQEASDSTPSASPPADQSQPDEPQLPTTLEAGQPLPSLEKAQSDTLSQKEYQSVQESGVLAESLARSRHKWARDGIFEKFWSKPSKKKAAQSSVPGDDSKSQNPSKESMSKIGHITITVEPHLFDATVYAVKDPTQLPSANAKSTQRPVLQYGPTSRPMPPPPKPSSTPSRTESPAQSAQPASADSSAQPASSTAPTTQGPTATASSQPLSKANTSPATPQSSSVLASPRPPVNPQLESAEYTQQQLPQLSHSSPRGLESVLAPPRTSAPTGPRPAGTADVGGASNPHAISASGLNPSRVLAGTAASPAVTHQSQVPSQPQAQASPSVPVGAKPPAQSGAAGADPIIVTLAERASEDPHLRDLMKRVAVGDAAVEELAHFQRIIDKITAEYKSKSVPQGPSAEQLIVDGKTVMYFAGEVRNILDIVLASNPHQKSIDLRVPQGSDPLVILLVKKALDDAKVRSMVTRIAQGKAEALDANNLKVTLDHLKEDVTKSMHAQPQSSNVQTPHSIAGSNNSHAMSQNGNSKKQASTSTSQAASSAAAAASSQQALRSKGPPPAVKPDISAIALEFAGGSGDRYLFPKYSILDFVSPTQAVASFLLVRKGSQSDQSGDPALDYYQPITIRLQSQSPRVLENIARAIAPADDVRQYMDETMDNMTRAEYLCLAMRLPRPESDTQQTDDQGGADVSKPGSRAQTHQSPGVLWASGSAVAPAPPTRKPLPKAMGEDDKYQSFIASIS